MSSHEPSSHLFSRKASSKSPTMSSKTTRCHHHYHYSSSWVAVFITAVHVHSSSCYGLSLFLCVLFLLFRLNISYDMYLTSSTIRTPALRERRIGPGATPPNATELHLCLDQGRVRGGHRSLNLSLALKRLLVDKSPVVDETRGTKVLLRSD